MGKNAAKSSAAVLPPAPAPQRIRLEIYESQYDQNPVPTPLYDLMEAAFRDELERMVEKRLAAFKVAAKMDWMQRDPSKECGVISARDEAQAKLIRHAVDALEVKWNGVAYRFQVLSANRTDRHKAYVRLFTLKAKSSPREYIRGVVSNLAQLDPFLTADDFRPGHPTKMDGYIRMTIFVSDRLRRFIHDGHNTIPAIGGALRVDFQDEIQARRAAAAAAVDKSNSASNTASKSAAKPAAAPAAADAPAKEAKGGETKRGDPQTMEGIEPLFKSDDLPLQPLAGDEGEKKKSQKQKTSASGGRGPQPTK